MLLNVKSASEAWKSPDGKVTIWDITAADNTVWQTMSGKIAGSIGQAIEVTTRVNQKGKTFLILPPTEAYPSASSAVAYAPNLAPVPGISPDLVARFEAAVAAFSDAVESFKGRSKTNEPADDQPPLVEPEGLAGDDFDRAIAALGGEVVDDLR